MGYDKLIFFIFPPLFLAIKYRIKAEKTWAEFIQKKKLEILWYRFLSIHGLKFLVYRDELETDENGSHTTYNTTATTYTSIAFFFAGL